VFVSIAVPFLSLIHAGRQVVCACFYRMTYIEKIDAVIGAEITYIAPVNIGYLRWTVVSISIRNEKKSGSDAPWSYGGGRL
jgi:hypothetical protein